MGQESTKAALSRYYQRQARVKRPKKAYGKPEKALVVELLAWLRASEFTVEVYESKATYNPRSGAWMNQSMKAGTPDLMGTDPDGMAVYIEAKAPTKLLTFNRPSNHRQREFINQKILANAFACVVDSVERLKTIYWTWKNTIPEMRKAYLMSCLPGKQNP